MPITQSSATEPTQPKNNLSDGLWRPADYDRAAHDAMSWFGWGSPVGLALFFVGLAACFVLVKFALSL